jgi:hypothetical protein
MAPLPRSLMTTQRNISTATSKRYAHKGDHTTFQRTSHSQPEPGRTLHEYPNGKNTVPSLHLWPQPQRLLGTSTTTCSMPPKQNSTSRQENTLPVKSRDPIRHQSPPLRTGARYYGGSTVVPVVVPVFWSTLPTELLTNFLYELKVGQMSDG